jgi:hypothetical protein
MGNLRQKYTTEEWDEMVDSTNKEWNEMVDSIKPNKMTANEFNTKYKDYLEEGHYGLDIHIPSVTKYLDEVFQDLIKIPGFQYSQIKDKYFNCRFYTNLYEVLGNKVGAIISNEVERKVTMIMEVHSDYLKHKD